MQYTSFWDTLPHKNFLEFYELLCVPIFAHFYYLVVFPGMDVPQLVQPFTHWKTMWVVSTFSLLWIKLLWTFMFKFLRENKSSFFWDKCPRMQLLGHMLNPFLVWNELPNYFPECRVLFFKYTAHPVITLHKTPQWLSTATVIKVGFLKTQTISWYYMISTDLSKLILHHSSCSLCSLAF